MMLFMFALSDFRVGFIKVSWAVILNMVFSRAEQNSRTACCKMVKGPDGKVEDVHRILKT